MKTQTKYTAIWAVATLFACLLSIFPFAHLGAQGSQGPLSGSIEGKLRRDAARLALRAHARGTSVALLPVTIPEASINEFYYVLSQVYKESSVARGLEECNVHTFPDPPIDHFVIIVERNVAWVEALRNGKSKTADPQFNNLQGRFGLNTQVVQWDDSHDAVTVQSNKPLNIAALAKKFESVEGVTRVDLGIPTTTGNDIQALRITGGWEITYFLRFGSGFGVPAKEHRWVFRCTNTGSVSFMGESGDPVPAWMRCMP